MEALVWPLSHSFWHPGTASLGGRNPPGCEYRPQSPTHNNIRFYGASQVISEQTLRDKYLQKGMSMRDIAAEFSSSKTHIRDLIIRFKIPIRVPHKLGRSDFRQSFKLLDSLRSTNVQYTQ